MTQFHKFTAEFLAAILVLLFVYALAKTLSV